VGPKDFIASPELQWTVGLGFIVNKKMKQGGSYE
jgi:hypothetical protein